MEYHSKDSIEDKWVEDISMQIIPFFHVVGLVFWENIWGANNSFM
jgi:hypothetical protein